MPARKTRRDLTLDVGSMAPATARLVQELLAEVRPGDRLLNVGAGNDPWIEFQLDRRLQNFTVDRVDVDPPTVAPEHVSFAHVGECWTAPVEAMPDVPTGGYRLAFANYVLEHVRDLDAAARELARVLRPGGLLVLAVPNPASPPMRVAALTPLWLHRLARGRDAWETVYAFRNPDELAAVFERHGFGCRGVHRYSNLAGYFERLRLGRIGALVDALVERTGSRRLLCDACLVLEAPAQGTGLPTS
jgi:ubiquinone/menaquinone biosynthesis C-methylase UbiE